MQQMEYTELIAKILGESGVFNLAGHNAQVVTDSSGLANVLVKGFCDVGADSVDVVLTDEVCAEEAMAEPAEGEPQTEEVEAVPVAETEVVEAEDAVAVEE